MLPWHEIERRAVAFQKTWKNCPGDERQEAQTFEKDLMHVFGIDWRDGLHEYHTTLKDGSIGYIDYLLPGKILIEMKSKGQSLTRAYTQAMTYVHSLKPDEIPTLVLVSDFDKIHVYNLKKNHPYKPLRVSQLKSRVRIFGLLAGYGVLDEEKTEIEVNTEASYMMARIHDEMKANGYEGHALEVYLVRLLFCMFADDTGIFERDSFSEYLKDSKIDGSDLSSRLMVLFSVLNIPHENRMKTISPELLKFRYINGQLFEESLPPAFFNAKMRQLLINCSEKFDWSQISPSIFGAMFQGVMNPEERRALGAHYTSEENILKVIEPLFLDDLYDEFERAKSTKKELHAFQEKIASLKFFDPAMGCGNFLIVAYKKLRELEFEILKLIIDDSTLQIVDTFIKVSIEQFYGIEIEEFPSQIAQVSLILIKHLMDIEVSNHFGFNIIDFPIKHNANIVHGNALRIDWETVCTFDENTYIFGNPPFKGARNMSAEQKQDLKNVFDDWKNVGNLDFVAAWYKKAADVMEGTFIKAAFVSTNSISQGNQAGILWQPLLNQKFRIIFAYRTFKWSNEAKGQAAVHCVIIGFQWMPLNNSRLLFMEPDYSSASKVVENISPYLIDAPNIVVMSRSTPISDIPEMGIGNKPIDGGHYLFTYDEMLEFLAKEPGAEKYFYPWYGSYEFINKDPRYCLYLAQAMPSDLRKMPLVLDRIEAVRNYRLASKSPGTVKIADQPTRFHVENIPSGNFLIIPEVSSENRRYIPIGFMEEGNLASNLVRIIPKASLYHFGVLTSATHMAWMRQVAGRLESRYRYSKDIVYNNFPWPEVTEDAEKNIKKSAKNVLRVRDTYPDETYADLYDVRTMPSDLLKAHQANNKAVREAYGARWVSEDECVADLLKRYQALTIGK